MDNLFQGNDLPTPNLDEFKKKWQEKFPDAPAELIEAKAHSDYHIKTVEANNAELRKMYQEAKDELTAKAKWDEYLDRLNSNKPQNDLVAPTPANDVKSEPTLDLTKIEELVQKKIQETEQQKRESENFRKVQSKLQEKFGNNYADVLQEQQTSLGLSKEEINSLAKKSPEAFFRVLGLNDQPSGDGFVSPPRNNQRNNSFAPKVERRDYNYYQNLKKTDPKLYLDPKIQVQMEKDALAMGMDFFS
jgi:chaperonin cofactor prefoldin